MHYTKMSRLCVISIVVFFSYTFNVHCEILVKIETGTIQGKAGVSRGGQKFYSFYGIPYAAPPIGKLRLKAPIPPDPWKGVRNAMDEPPMCVQPASFNVLDESVRGQEDCLYINVFTPDFSDSKRNLPVIVYVHGGGFQLGEGAEFGPHYILDKNIVYVTFNYRLGLLGFLSLGNNQMPGNYALKDQNLALKWVQSNIAAFGGNPNDVTLMGESAGSACVHLHFFSPLSKGLFHKAIMQSGSAISMWSYSDVAFTKALGTSFAFVSGCYNAKASEILRCLQELPAHEFVKKERVLYTWGSDPSALFRPTLEQDTEGSFLPNAPSKTTYVTKNIPILTGINSGEGIFRILGYLSGDGKAVKVLNDRYKFLLPIVLQYKFVAEPKDVDEITNKIRKFYFGLNAIGRNTDTKLVDMVTDALFSFPFMETVSSYNGTRYAYLYDHRGNYSIQDFGNYPKDLGICHGDEVPLILSQKEVNQLLNPTDIEVSKRLVNYWTNFAIHGDPNGNEKYVWHPVSTDAIEYLHVQSKQDTMDKSLWEDRIKLWRNLPLGNRFQ